MRSLSFHAIAKEIKKTLTKDELALFQSYADGVNAYVREAWILPIQFWLVGTGFEEWTIEDSLMLSRLLEFYLSISLPNKAFRSYIAETIGTDFLKEFFQTSPEYQFIEDYDTIISEEDIVLKNKKPHKVEFTGKNIRKPSEYNIISNPTQMSDSWVINGSFTKTGKPLLANDPHLKHKIPGFWYLMTLQYPDNIVTGFSVTGLPIIAIGRNEHVAWGITSSTIENIDLFWLNVNRTSEQYYYDGKWITFNKRKEIIKVKNGEDIEKVFYSTNYGPVILDTPTEASAILMYPYS